MMSILNPALLNLVVLLAIVLGLYPIVKPKGYLQLVAYGLGAIVLGLIGSSWAERLVDEVLFKPPPTNQKHLVKRLFVDFAGQKDIQGDTQLYRFLALTGGEYYSVLREGECLKRVSPKELDYLGCLAADYAFFRSRIAQKEQCPNDLAEGRLSENLSIEDALKYFKVPFRAARPIDGVEGVRQVARQERSPTYDYQLCVEYKRVENIPDDALKLMTYYKEQFDSGYILEKQVRGFANFRAFYGAPLRSQEKVQIPTEYCYSKSLNLMQTLLRSRDDRRDSRYACLVNELQEYYRIYFPKGK